ncbi:pleckstrin homology domain-containing family G member 3 [Carettochelys insculpta]|uniref:pleckstrin homology domain-containing family G member 3 n=1 Tax=Carettochelys insculpta TaxID=44489 RepID=UPI003EB7CCA1
MFLWEEMISLPWRPTRISKLWESPRLPAAPCPGCNDRMPVCAAVGASPPERPMSRVPMEGRDKAPGQVPAWEGDVPRARQLHDSNNNASPGGWLGRKGSRPLSPFGARTPAGASHKLSYLERVVLELVESERTYVRDLRSIVEDYLGRVIDVEELLRPEEVSALFGNIEDVYELSSELLQDLDSCDKDPVAVARCFVDRSQDFDIYTQYCNNYPNSVAALTECMRNKRQAKFFRERQEQIGHALPLGSYLLKPVQRILKYHLLLQEVAKHFDLEQAGYEVVEEAIDTMTGVAWYINDMKRRHEHAVRLQEIQSLLLHWKGPDLTTFGELVLEGSFRVQRARNQRVVFLFDRALLVTKRRGDHFVCQSHIPCSSLMLIEGTRDSLCFSVAHYQHNKQQCSIQAKSAEEKRVWTHHLKRLILENHHAVIPQKAKEAILEMDSSRPARYRYSPERLKKAKSCQAADEEPAQGRQGRRQSEPTKQLGQQLAEPAGLKLPLRVERWDFCHLHTGPVNVPENGLGVCLFAAASCGWLRCMQAGRGLAGGHLAAGPFGGSTSSSGARGRGDAPGSPCLSPEQHSGSAGALLEAGASAWQPAASQGGTDEEKEAAAEGKEAEQEQAPGKSWLEELAVEAAGPEEEEGRVAEEQDKGPKGSQEPESQESRSSLEVSSAIPEAAPEPDELSEEEHQEETVRSPEPGLLTQQREEELKQRPDAATAESPEEPKALSSEEEEEEEEEELAKSILPPSVLDHASLITEMFANGFSRRSSLALEDSRPAGFLTPRLASRSSSVLSLEGSEKGQRHGSASEPQGEAGSPERRGAASPGPAEPERSPCRRKESMLSPRDRVLLDKIKSYYEGAERRDAGFSLRRRESLSYIPKGLVRNSVCRLNSLPPPQHAEAGRGAGARAGGARTAAWVLTGVREAGPGCALAGEEEFRPAAEMLPVWAGMEKLSGERAGAEQPRGGSHNGLDPPEPLLILEADELSAIAEESPESRSPTERAVTPRLAREPGPARLGRPARPPPRLSEAELRERLKNKVYQLARRYSLRIKSRQPPGHRQLAVLEQPGACALHDGQREVNGGTGPEPARSSAAYEQLVLQEYSPHPPPAATASSRDKSLKRFSFSPCGPLSPGPGACSPLSPLAAETFSWPDVQQLRSRYSLGSAAPRPHRPLPVNRSRSAPEKMAEEPPGRGGWSGWEQSSGPAWGPEESPAPCCQRPPSAGALHVTAQAMLGDQRVIILEKVPCAGEPPAPEEPPADATSYVHIRSPTSRERISLKAVAERCKAYQESDEYRRREEPGWEQGAAGPQGRVRNLRARFQSLNSAS